MKVISMKGLVEKAHGKICQCSDSSVAYRKKDGAMFSQRRCNPRDLVTKPYTIEELQHQSDFASKSKIASAWTAANRVYKDDGKTIDYEKCTDDYKAMRDAFDAQDKYVTFQAFVWSCIKDGAVVVPTSSAQSPSSTEGESNPGNSENEGGEDEEGGGHVV